MNEMYPMPRVGDIFTEVNGKKFTVVKLIDVSGDSWIEYQNEIKQPFYCRTEAFLARFRITSSEM
jgi:hypothetical protein